MEKIAGASVVVAEPASAGPNAPETEQGMVPRSTEADPLVTPSHALVAEGSFPVARDSLPAAGDGTPTGNGSLFTEGVRKAPADASVEQADDEGDVLFSARADGQPTIDCGNGPSSEMGSLDDAQRFFDDGHTAFRDGDYDQAAELLSQALEIRASHYGELAMECAFTYYKYGCALLYKAQSESDPLGEVKDSTEPADTERDENGKEEDEDDVEEDEESDLDMAWKMLDIARVIYERQPSHSIEEVDVITALADVSLEREDFEMCFRDYTRALEILEGLVEPDDRGIAELCFKLSLAQQLGYKPREALRYCQQAVSVCEARLRRLRNEVASAKGLVDCKGKSPICDGVSKDAESAGASLPPSNIDASAEAQSSSFLKQEGEIKEIEELLEDLKDKVVELNNMASGPSLLDALKESNPDAVNSIKQVMNVTAQLVSHQEGGSGSGSGSHAEPSNGFDASSIALSAAPVTDLGVIGRGVKRAVSNGPGPITKKRSLDDMMTRGGSGDTQIGFGTNTGEGGSS